MRVVRLAATAIALALAATPALAGSGAGVTFVYGIPPLAFPLPPAGYAFDPSDASAPVYIVEQGPVIEGPGVYAYHGLRVPPTYWDDGYAVVTPHAYPTPFPYVRHGSGGRLFARRSGLAPYGVHPYRPRLSARFIHMR